jgi:hypothetical protein
MPEIPTTMISAVATVTQGLNCTTGGFLSRRTRCEALSDRLSVQIGVPVLYGPASGAVGAGDSATCGHDRPCVRGLVPLQGSQRARVMRQVERQHSVEVGGEVICLLLASFSDQHNPIPRQ